MRLLDSDFDQLLPSYLLSSEKGRIKAALQQFYSGDEIGYEKFYVSGSPFLMQGDLFNNIKGINWNDETSEFENGFTPAMLLSNSCDVTLGNRRSINQKQALFAPIIPVPEWVEELKRDGFNDSEIRNFHSVLKRQEFTNIFYLPSFRLGGPDYMVKLDQINWLPSSEVLKLTETLANNRAISLSNWGYYILVLKLSFHLCRVPEEAERPVSE